MCVCEFVYAYICIRILVCICPYVNVVGVYGYVILSVRDDMWWCYSVLYDNVCM